MTLQHAKRCYNINRLFNRNVRSIVLNDSLIQMKICEMLSPWMIRDVWDVCLFPFILVWVIHICQCSPPYLKLPTEVFKGFGTHSDKKLFKSKPRHIKNFTRFFLSKNWLELGNAKPEVFRSILLTGDRRKDYIKYGSKERKLSGYSWNLGWLLLIGCP